MILEGVVTTLAPDRELNIAPMGPIVDESMKQLVLRPFQSSTTYHNLKATRCGTFHITDDVLLIAQAALDRLEQIPSTFQAERIDGRVLSDCCRWYEFEIVNLDDSAERTTFTADIVHSGRKRDFLGFNRAKHAVLEATILATRLQFVSEFDLRKTLTALAIPVEKTSGPRERAAFELVTEYVDNWYQRQGISPRDK